MEKSILRALEYFSFFDYPPTADEIYTFLPKTLPKERFMSILEEMGKKSLLTSSKMDDRWWKVEDGTLKIEGGLKERFRLILPSTFYLQSSSYRYTLSQYMKKVKSYELRVKNSLEKIQKILPFIQFISCVPFIKLIGLSGSCAMLNADPDHDVDLFIITSKNRMFTVRFFALLLSQLMGIRRNRHTDYQQSLRIGKDKVCLNLFFDESDLSIPDFKKSEYVAHEILQMKPLIVRGSIYQSFLKANKWIFGIFPNAQKIYDLRFKNYEEGKKIIRKSYLLHLKSLGDGIEFLLKKLQLYFIRKHQTTEIITDHQLWFHPDDFEKKLGQTKNTAL